MEEQFSKSELHIFCSYNIRTQAHSLPLHSTQLSLTETDVSHPAAIIWKLCFKIYVKMCVAHSLKEHNSDLPVTFLWSNSLKCYTCRNKQIFYQGKRRKKKGRNEIGKKGKQNNVKIFYHLMGSFGAQLFWVQKQFHKLPGRTHFPSHLWGWTDHHPRFKKL